MRKIMSGRRVLAFAAALSAATAGCDRAQPDEGTPSDVRSELAYDSDGGLITGIGLVGPGGEPLDTVMASHRARVKMDIAVAKPRAPHHIMFGFIQQSDESTPPEARQTCLVADWTETYGAAEDGAETTVSLVRDVVIPEECRFGDGVMMNFFASIDPLMQYEAQQAEEQGQPPPRSYNTQFFDEAGTDLNGQDRNQFCKGLNGEAGCVTSTKVSASAGHNLAVSDVTTPSSIGTIDKACSVDGAAPLAWINTTVLLAGSPSHDGVTKDQEPFDVLSKLSSDPTLLDFSICPSGDEPGSCAPGTSFAPLAIKGEGELTAAAQITKMATDQPTYFGHALYPDPAGAACARLNGADADESWLDHSHFRIRACVRPPFTETRNGQGDAGDDNCKSVDVRIVRAESSDPGADGELSTLQFSNSWSNTFGGGPASVTVAASRVATANLTGASVQKSLTVNLGGWFSQNLLTISAGGSSNTSLARSVNGSFSVLGNSYWPPAGQPTYSYSGGPSFNAQSATASYTLMLGPLPITFAGTLYASAGLTFAYDIQAQNGPGPSPFNTATVRGRTQVDITPYANTWMTISVSTNIGIMAGGVTANVTLLNVSLPSKDKMDWGRTTIGGKPSMIVAAQSSFGLSANTLSGNIHGWVEGYVPAWCQIKKKVFGYTVTVDVPCLRWANIYDQNLGSWGGGTTNLNFYTGSTVQTLQ